MQSFYRPFQLFLLFLAFGLVLWILKPFLQVIILAITFALILQPLYGKALKIFKYRKNMSCFFVLILFLGFIFLPGVYFISVLVKQGIQIVNHLNDFLSRNDLNSLNTIYTYLHKFILKLGLSTDFLNSLDIRGYIETFVKKISVFIVQEGGSLLSNVFSFITNTFLFFFMLFYFLRDLDKLWEKIKAISPLPEEQEEKILNYLSGVAKKVVLGNLFTAVIQGVVGGIGLAIAGIPGVFWGSLMGLTSLIPVVGTALVWVPAVIYLFWLGKSALAIFLGLWCILLVGSIDNFLRPFLIGRGDALSPFFLFLALLGGVSTFGFLGLIYGPLIFAFALVMFRLYQLEFKELLCN